MPSEYKRILYAFADHLTFNRELSTFFAEHQFSRQAVLEAVTWSIGAVVSKSKLVGV